MLCSLFFRQYQRPEADIERNWKREKYKRPCTWIWIKLKLWINKTVSFAIKSIKYSSVGKVFLLFKFFFPSFIDFDGVRRREFVRFVSFHLVREEGNRFESDQEENQSNQQKKNTQSLSVYVSKAAWTNHLMCLLASFFSHFAEMFKNFVFSLGYQISLLHGSIVVEIIMASNRQHTRKPGPALVMLNKFVNKFLSLDD